MSLVVIPVSSPQSTCMLAYENLLELGTVNVQTNGLDETSPDYPIENAYDWLTTDFFTPSALGTTTIELTLDTAREADYLAFYAHNLDTAPATIKLQYHDGSTWVDASSTYSPANHAPFVGTFTVATSTQWRVVIVSSVDIPSIGVLSFGKALYTQYGAYIGYTEPVLARANELINSVSERGTFLGRSIKASGVSTTLVLQYASDQWVRDYWLPFVKHAEQKPFFYVWDTDGYPNEAAFMWVDGNITPPTHTYYGYMGTTLNVRGLVE